MDRMPEQSRSVWPLARIFAILLLILTFVPAIAAARSPDLLIIDNVRIFDGVGNRLSPLSRVVVNDGRIAQIEPASGAPPPESGRYLDGGGRVMMPGLIDTHVHLSLPASLSVLRQASWDYIGARMGEAAEAMLLRGFTTVRDMGGPVFGLKRAIDEGAIHGPRIFPSGALVSQTAGHGDFREFVDPHPRWTGHETHWQRLGYYRLADGTGEVLAAVRDNLAHGATQIKVAAGGGIASAFDPIDSVQYSSEELAAAVAASRDWGTYLAVHAYTAPAIRRALEAGALSIEHGYLIDEDGARLMAERGAVLSTQFALLADTAALPELTGAQRRQVAELQGGMETMIRLARAHDLRITFASDALGPSEMMGRRQASELRARSRWFSPVEILRQVTSDAASLLALSGERNPYPAPLGLIRVGATADLLVLDGNPLDDVAVLAEPERNLRLIVKDGRIVKDSLQSRLFSFCIMFFLSAKQGPGVRIAGGG